MAVKPSKGPALHQLKVKNWIGRLEQAQGVCKKAHCHLPQRHCVSDCYRYSWPHGVHRAYQRLFSQNALGKDHAIHKFACSSRQGNTPDFVSIIERE
jgi:hypothetical protein